MTLTRSVAFKPLRYSAVFLATLCILFGQSIDVAGELVARWEFNEGKGNTVKDSSGKGHDGDFAGGDPQWVPGVAGSALAFDGDDYVAIDAWITETGAADFTITAWIKTTKTSVSFLTKNNEDRSLDFHEKLFYVGDAATSGGGKTGAVEWVGHSCDWIRGDTDVSDGKWHHVAVTWEFKALEGHIYVNGIEGVHHMGYNGGEDIKGNTWQIGFTSGWPGGVDYEGAVDDIRIYDSTLTANEIEQAMVEGLAVDPTGLLAVSWAEIKTR